MSFTPDTTERLEAAAQVLWRCFVCGAALLLAWTAMFLAAPDLLERTHGELFNFSAHELMLIHYCGLAFVKLCVLLFFLFPYISIRWLLHRQRA